jgi:hypothetical protein
MTQRIQRYWYVDGLVDLSMGILFAVIGLSSAAVSQFAGSALGWLVVVVQVVIILGSAWLVSWAVRAIKARLTYPRTGYVAYPAKKGKVRLLRIGISGGIAMATAAIIAMLDRTPSLTSWLPLISGALIALAMLYVGFRFDLTRFFFLAIYDIAAGWVFSLAQLEDEWKFGLFLCTLGVGLVISGGVTLLRYLRSTRPAASREE